MKRLFVPGLMMVVLFACNSQGGNNTDTANNEDKHKMMLEANRQVMKAMETGNVDTLKKYISTDATDHGGGPNGTDMKGQAIIDQLASVHNDIDNFKNEIVQQAANDDYIFALTHTTGTTNKPVWGMPAHYKMDGTNVDVIKVKDMKMVDHWSYMSPAEMMKMMPQGGAEHGNNGGGKMGNDSAK